jgi:hypothetical protein
MAEEQTKKVIDNYAAKITFHSLCSLQAILSAGSNKGVHRLYRCTCLLRKQDQRGTSNRLSHPLYLPFRTSSAVMSLSAIALPEQ